MKKVRSNNADGFVIFFRGAFRGDGSYLTQKKDPTSNMSKDIKDALVCETLLEVAETLTKVFTTDRKYILIGITNYYVDFNMTKGDSAIQRGFSIIPVKV